LKKQDEKRECREGAPTGDITNSVDGECDGRKFESCHLGGEKREKRQLIAIPQNIKRYKKRTKHRQSGALDEGDILREEG